MVKLYLDDSRPDPAVSHKLMEIRIGQEAARAYTEPGWVVVKNYKEFVHYILDNGKPDLISFDHDLADEHYNPELFDKLDWEKYHENPRREMTGLDCARFLKDFCSALNSKLPICYIHSMNPVGRQNINNLLNGK